MNRPLSMTLLAVFTAECAAQSGTPVRIHVDANAMSGADDGSTWTNAFRGAFALRNALAAAPTGAPVEIWVADGVYLPAPAGTPTASFALRDDVALYGGFAGGETSIAQRDPAINFSVLSGDLAQNDVLTIASGGIFSWAQATENAHHVVTANGIGASARLDGFVVRRGRSGGSATDHGGNVLLVDASPTIANCTIMSGESSVGAGLYVSGGTPAVTGCTFVDNQASTRGGGACVEGPALFTFDRCTWRTNRGGRGAGLFVGREIFTAAAPPPQVSLVDCRFESNTSPIGIGSGPGLFVHAAPLDAFRCVFSANRSGAGGGGAYVHSATATFRACDFARNSGDFDGGGACYVDGASGAADAHFVDSRFFGNNGVAFVVSGASMQMTNCTLVANDVPFTFVTWPAVTAVNAGSAHLRNCIVGQHTVGGGTFSATWNGVITADDCCIAGLPTSLPGANNFDLPPAFVSPLGADGIAGTLDDDLSLGPTSPCIDRSRHSWRTVVSTTDVAGRARSVDQPSVMDTGSGCAPLPDLGALERQPDGPWIDLVSGSTTSAACAPHLAASGPLTAGSTVGLFASGAPATTLGIFVLGVAPLNLPLFGGTLVPDPLVLLAAATSPTGHAAGSLQLVAGTPPGLLVLAQGWFIDPTAAQGWSASNTQLGIAP